MDNISYPVQHGVCANSTVERFERSKPVLPQKSCVDDSTLTMSNKHFAVSSSCLQSTFTKFDHTFESNEQTDSPPGRPRRKTSIDLSDANVSPSSTISFVDDETCLLHVPLFSEDDETCDETDSEATQERRVRFVVDEDGEIDEDVSSRSYPDHALSPDDIATCWYNRTERIQLKIDTPKECRACIREIEDYRRSALKVCALASRKDYEGHLAKCIKEIRVVTDARARGLERAMLTRMLLPKKSGRQNVYAVLRTQQLIRELDESTYTVDGKAALIADQYETNSQYATRWAHILAIGDVATGSS